MARRTQSQRSSDSKQPSRDARSTRRGADARAQKSTSTAAAGRGKKAARGAKSPAPQSATADTGVRGAAAERPRSGGAAVAAPRRANGVVGAIGRHVADFLSRPSVDYTMLLIITGALTFVGLIMAASITGPSSFYDDAGRYVQGANVYGQFTRQLMMVVLGLIAFYVALRMKPSTLRAWSPYLIAIALLLLVLVFTPIGIGEAEKGSQSWLKLGPLRLQPSEVAKVALVMWGADWLAGMTVRRSRRLYRLDPLVVYTAMMGLVCFLIFLENDLGMTLTVLVVGSIVLFLAGAAYRSFIGAVLFFVPLALIYILFGHGSSGNNFRASRITTYLNSFTGNFTNTQNEAFQSYQGFLSLAEGGFFGVGVGQSRAKWFYLPEAKNDFVFAIVGEELGTFGAIVVVLLFAGLGFFGMRAAQRNADPYLRLLAGGLVLGIVFQAMYNIGYVVGLLPVTGIQLPLISVGGTSTIITLASLGLVANCARHEPETVSAIADRGRSNFDKWLGIPAPRPFVPPAEGRLYGDNPDDDASRGRSATGLRQATRSRRTGDTRSASDTTPAADGRAGRDASSSRLSRAARSSRQSESSRQVPVTARGRGRRSDTTPKLGSRGDVSASRQAQPHDDGPDTRNDVTRARNVGKPSSRGTSRGRNSGSSRLSSNSRSSGSSRASRDTRSARDTRGGRQAGGGRQARGGRQTRGDSRR